VLQVIGDNMADNRGISGDQLGRLGAPDGAPVFVIAQQTVSGTASYTVVDSPIPFPFRVVDVVCVATAAGGVGDTITVKNGSTAITNAMDLNVSDKAVVRAGTIDDAEHNIEKGLSNVADDTLVVSTASGAVALVYIFCVRI
jgi:hypothetical protein